jgi:oxygen-dependent protoporphyrinogen oxidase
VKPPAAVDALVVGGGLGGLVCATALVRAGWRVTLLEAALTPGGYCQTHEREGYRFERGPQTYRIPEDGAFARALTWAGLRGEVVATDPSAKERFLLRHGELHSVPRGLRHVLSVGGVLRLMSEPLRAARSVTGSESVAGFARRRLGPEAARVLVDAFVSGVFAGDPERLELRSAFPALARAEADHGGIVRARLADAFPQRSMGSFARGMGSLTASLAEDLGPTLRLGRRVQGFAPPALACGWIASAIDPEGHEELHEASHLVLATPGFVSAQLLAPLDPHLGILLEGIHYANVAVVSLGYERSAFRRGPPQGFGFLAPHCEGLRSLGCIYASSLFPEAAPEGKVGLRVLVGGTRDPGAVDLRSDELVDRVRADIEPLLGITRAPELTWVQRHRRAIPQYERGHAARLRAIDQRLTYWPRLALTGGAYRGVGVSDVAEDALAVASHWVGAPAEPVPALSLQ